MNPSSTWSRAGAAAAALLAVVSASGKAFAVDCTTLPSPIYAIGGSSQQPIFAKVGTALSKLTPPQTFIYQSSGGSCSGVNAIINNQPIAGNGTYWDATGAALTCTFTVSQPADLGVSGTYPTYCPGITQVPAGVGDFLGPVQSFDFIVPYQSSQSSISAEAAYFVFGFNAGASTPSYPVAPWTVPADIITRNNQSGAAIILALALNVPLADLTKAGAGFFTDGKNNAGSLNAVAGATGPAIEATLGFVSSEVAEGAPPMKVNVLAYQHKGQQCGWLPSSSSTVFDKVNVRNGHYALWANIHFLAAVDSTNTPTNANAKKVIGWFRDTATPPGGVDVDALTIQAGAVIDCAMEVKRTTDMGPLLPYAPAAPCGCYFTKTATGSTSCPTCNTNADCPVSATNCRKGYCEVN
jgi:hypothetical protein